MNLIILYDNKELKITIDNKQKHLFLNWIIQMNRERHIDFIKHLKKYIK